MVSIRIQSRIHFQRVMVGPLVIVRSGTHTVSWPDAYLVVQILRVYKLQLRNS